MNNNSNNRRYCGGVGGGGGRGFTQQYRHSVPAPPNYSTSMIPSGHYGGHMQQPRPVSNHITTRPRYPNNNYMVTHRMEQQYTVEVINPAEQQLQHRQHANIVPVATIPIPNPSHPPPPPQDPAPVIEPPRTDEMAVAQYMGASRGESVPVSSTTSSPPPVRPNDDDLQCSELENAGHHYKELGTKLGLIHDSSESRLKRVQELRVEYNRLKATKDALTNELLLVQNEKEELTNNYERDIVYHQNESRKATQDCITWRTNAIKLNQELEASKNLLEQKKRLVDSLEKKLAKIIAENAKILETIKELEGKGEKLKSEKDLLNEMVDQKKREIKEKREEIEILEAKYTEKSKDFKKLEEETSAMKKNLIYKLDKEQRKVTELEAAKVKSEHQIKTQSQEIEKHKDTIQKSEEISIKLKEKIAKQKILIEKKQEEINRSLENIQSIQSTKLAQDRKIKEQNAQINQLKMELDNMKQRNEEKDQELEKQRDMQDIMIAEHLEMFARPTTLNKLLQTRMQSSMVRSSTAVTCAILPQLQYVQLAHQRSSECSSPLASDEDPPEPSSTVLMHHVQENECSSNSTCAINNDNNNACTSSNGEGIEDGEILTGGDRKRKQTEESSTSNGGKKFARKGSKNDDDNNETVSDSRRSSKVDDSAAQGSHVIFRSSIPNFLKSSANNRNGEGSRNSGKISLTESSAYYRRIDSIKIDLPNLSQIHHNPKK